MRTPVERLCQSLNSEQESVPEMTFLFRKPKPTCCWHVAT